ncbi:hypothetical protein [Streptomyces sp. Da 82-17]|uniref:hypothetical protein n=1 Tax=Streptomyces sp. Da 82-17 TaxID=3377116 RepID=UPI0038D3CD1F
MSRYDVVGIEYTVAADAHLPAGRVTHVIEEPGRSLVRVRRGHATEAVCAELNSTHRHIDRHGLWLRRAADFKGNQSWSSTDLPAGPTDGRATPATEARFESVPAAEFPEDVLCVMREQPGLAVWLVRDDHMSKQACDELTEYLTHTVGAGLWVQRWDGSAASRCVTPREFVPDDA